MPRRPPLTAGRQICKTHALLHSSNIRHGVAQPPQAAQRRCLLCAVCACPPVAYNTQSVTPAKKSLWGERGAGLTYVHNYRIINIYFTIYPPPITFPKESAMPGQFITSFLNTHFTKFSTLVGKAQPTDFCSLRNFDISSGKWCPDYANPLHREFYYLKYASAYMTEYYLAFKQIFDSNLLTANSHITTLSLGCGAMLDLVGFYSSIEESRNYKNASPIYLGIDIVDWNCDETRNINNASLYTCGIENFNSDQCEFPYDIIIFPKSISDIPENCLTNFANNISCSKLSNNICIINSKRDGADIDAFRAVNFCNILVKRCGYNINIIEQNINTIDCETKIENLIDNKFEFNDEIGWFLKEFGEKRLYCKCPEEDQQHCKDVLGKWPIRTKKFISYTIYHLEKH